MAPTAAGREDTAAGGTRGLPVGEVVTFAVLAVVGAYMALEAFDLGLRTNDAWVGPGTMPFAVGALLLVISLGLLGGALRRHRTPSADPVATPADAEDDLDIFGRDSRYRVRQLWAVIVALGVTIGLVPLLGLPLAFGLLVLVISTVVERRRVLVAAAVTAVSLVAVYLVFILFLRVPLPMGVVGEAVLG